MALLTSLPLELIDHALTFVAAGEPPSKRYIHEEPSVSLLISTYRPLKDLRQTCKILQHLSGGYLFASLKANIGEIPALTSFVQKYSLRGRVQSLMLYLIHSGEEESVSNDALATGKPESSFSELINASTWLQVQAIINAVDPSSVTFLMPPAAFESILPYKLELEDAWSFNIPYQILRLEQQQQAEEQAPARKPRQDRNIFTLRAWRHMIFNEGCSIKAYSTYEYFMKRTPSLLYPKRARHPVDSLEICSQMVSLDYIAVFPIYRGALYHDIVAGFKNLQRVRIQFSPAYGNDVLDNVGRLGRCQRSDLWNELQEAYMQFVRMLENNALWGNSLREFTLLDYSRVGLGDMVHRGYPSGYISDWRSQGEGSWIRNS